MDKESTLHHWCSLRKLCKSDEIDPPLSDLNGLPLVLVLIILVGSLALILLSGLRAVSSKMIWSSTSKTAVVIAWWWALNLCYCCWEEGAARFCCSCWGRITHLPCWALLWEFWGGLFCTKWYIGGWAIDGPAGAFLFFSTWWAVKQSSWVIAKLTSSL